MARLLRLAAGAFVVALGALVGCGPGASRGFAIQPGDLWIRNVTVISAEREAPLSGAHVVARGARIVYVGTDLPLGPNNEATVLQGEGRYLTPGLIDAHVHLAVVPGMTTAQESTQPAIVRAYDDQLPRSYLYYGFTAVIDLNVVDQARLQELRDASLGPAVFDCGNALALANGYPMVLSAPGRSFDDYPNFLFDPRQADRIPAAYPAANHTPRAAVERVAAGGGICVKAHVERGFGEFAGTLPTPTPMLLKEVREEARRRGLRFLLHANSEEAHRVAAEVKADIVVHGVWNWQDERNAPDLPASLRDVLAAERTAGVGMMPTSRVIGGLRDLADSTFLDRPALVDVLPASLLAWYRSQEGQWFAHETLAGIPQDRASGVFAAIQTRGQRAAVEFVHGGGRLVFGSDTPSAPTYANPPGYNGYLELQELESAGLTPRELFVSATLGNAQEFRLADYGTVESGKVASLLLLRDNPLASTKAFDSIETVVVAGRAVPRSSLSARR